MLVHGTCVALPDPADPDAWAGVLIRGPSGSGKSDLALRLIDEGARLIADDRTEVTEEKGELAARCPPTIRGLIEARGLGLVRLAPVETATLRLIVDPSEAGGAEPRLPDPQFVSICGVDTPSVSLRYGAASATARVRLALAATRLGLFATAAKRLDERSD